MSYPCLIHALEILNVYLEKNPGYPIDAIIQNENVIQCYRKWTAKNNFTQK
jgi:hypothetical protein